MNYVLYGNDESRIAQKLKMIQKEHQIPVVDYEFDATKDALKDVLNAIDMQSIFDDKKLIVIKNATFFTGRDTTKYDIDALRLRTNQDEQTIIVYMCIVDKKLSPRKKVAKEMLEHSKTIVCMALDQRTQQDYIQNKMKEIGLTLDRDAYRWFVSRVGMDAWHIDSELEKLRTYNDRVTLEDVKALVVPEPLDDIFKMVKALFDRNTLLLLSYYRNFRKLNMEPVAINSILAGQIRFLLQVRICLDKGMTQDEIASYLHAHPYRVKVNIQNAYDFTSDELLGQLSELAQLDQNMKSGLIDKDLGFEQFILNRL